MTEQPPPDNSMLLTAIQQVFVRLDEMDSKADRRHETVETRFSQMEGRMLGIERRIDFLTEQVIKHITDGQAHRGAA